LVVEVELPAAAAEALGWHKVIMEAEMAANLDREFEHGRDRLSSSLRAQLERGRDIRALAYQRALARVPRLNEGFEEVFERCAAFITPSAAGFVFKGLAAT